MIANKIWTIRAFTAAAASKKVKSWCKLSFWNYYTKSYIPHLEKMVWLLSNLVCNVHLYQVQVVGKPLLDQLWRWRGCVSWTAVIWLDCGWLCCEEREDLSEGVRVAQSEPRIPEHPGHTTQGAETITHNVIAKVMLKTQNTAVTFSGDNLQNMYISIQEAPGQLLLPWSK